MSFCSNRKRSRIIISIANFAESYRAFYGVDGVMCELPIAYRVSFCFSVANFSYTMSSRWEGKWCLNRLYPPNLFDPSPVCWSRRRLLVVISSTAMVIFSNHINDDGIGGHNWSAAPSKVVNTFSEWGFRKVIDETLFHSRTASKSWKPRQLKMSRTINRVAAASVSFAMLDWFCLFLSAMQTPTAPPCDWRKKRPDGVSQWKNTGMTLTTKNGMQNDLRLRFASRFDIASIENKQTAGFMAQVKRLASNCVKQFRSKIMLLDSTGIR